MEPIAGEQRTSLCRVCENPADYRLGAYTLCENHYRHATRERRSVWHADLAAILVLVGLVLVAQLLGPLIEPGVGLSTPLIAIGLLLAIVPAAVWLYIFYRRDRIEPEPRHMVVGVFLLGVLVAAAIGMPVVRDVFRVGSWMIDDLVVVLVGGFLVVGLVQEGLKYAVVRFSVYESREFDEPTDGILYGTAAGLGYATALNVAYVVDAGGAALGFAAIHVAVTALAHGAFGGMMGYFLSGQKLEARPIWWSAAGVVLASGLNSAFYTVQRAALAIDQPGTGLLLGPWAGLALAAAIAIGVSGVVIVAMRRHIASAMAGAQSP